MITANAIPVPVESQQRHDDFLPLQARVERHAKIVFRHLPPNDREEAVCETIAVAFQSFLRLKARGKKPVDFPSRMASYAALIVLDDRHLSGTDALSQRAQRRHGFLVRSFSVLNRRSVGEPYARRGHHGYDDEVEEQLYENTRTAPSEQAAFRIDFSTWLAARSPKDRHVIRELALGERTSKLARKFGVSPARISQKRREFHDSWREFQGEPSDDANVAVA